MLKLTILMAFQYNWFQLPEFLIEWEYLEKKYVKIMVIFLVAIIIFTFILCTTSSNSTGTTI
jgi:hypothetical protein